MDTNKIKELIAKHKILSGILAVIILIVLYVIYLTSFSSGSIQMIDEGYYGGRSSSKGMMYANSAPSAPGISREMVSDSVSYESAGDADMESPTQEQGTSERKVIQTASLDIFVVDTDKSIGEIKNIANKFKGYVEGSNVNQITEDTKGGYITIRVPAEKLDAVIEEVKKIAKEVRSESINASDVTDRYVDLSANLKNYTAEEAQYQKIMASAKTIEEILKVQQRLSDVRGRIERTQAQLIQMDRQTTMSTVTVNLTSEPDVKIFGVSWKPLNTIKLGFKDFMIDMRSIYEGLIGFLFKLPGFLLRLAFFVVVIVAVVKLAKFVYRKFKKQ